MRRTKLTILMSFMLVVISASSIFAQNPPKETTKSTKDEGDYVSEQGFRNKLYQLKHRDPNSLLSVLKLLGSGVKGASISANPEYRTLTVRDFPENLATIEEALARLDVPEPYRPDIEFRVYVLLASNTPGGGAEYPAELNEVIGQLRTTFKYKDYTLMTSSIHRAKEGPVGINNRGVAEAKKLTATAMPLGNPIFYEYQLGPIMMDAKAANPTVQIGMFVFNMRIPISVGTKINYDNIGFRTPVSLRDGEKVVVGTTTMEDKGLVVVLSERIIK